jgi:hypothetical protein
MKIIKLSPRMKSKFNCIDFWDKFIQYINRPDSILNTGWTAKSNLVAVATLKSSPLTLRALTTVAVHWVPGHSLIYGNEDADLELLPNVVPMVLLTPR